MEKQYVRDLQDKQTVDTYFLVRDKSVQVGKNGKPFMSLQVADNTGSIDGRIWDRVDELSAEFSIGDVVKIKGAIQIFQNRKQLIIHKLERMETSDFDMNIFLEKSRNNTSEMFAELYNIIKSMKNDHLRQLILSVVDDPEIKPKILVAPAAKTIHHAWIGGLLEHILSICKIMNFFATHYPFLNRDLLLFGAIFHDIGKLWELSYENGISYTDRGRLIGHMGIACELVDKKSAQILGFSDELRDICKHIIYAHHGRLEYGSPKRPKFMEAMIVAMVDDFDSKVATLDTFIRDERHNSQDKWSKYNTHFDRYFLLEDFNKVL